MNFRRILRIIHRDLGFFVVGITLVYGISGILLNHLGKNDPAFRTEAKTIQLQANLTEPELLEIWRTDNNLPPLKRIMRIDENRSRLFIEGGQGVYNSTDGSLFYEKHEKRVLIYWINRLHYNKVKGWSPVADFFAGSLIMLAITGLFMIKGKKGIAGSGKWYLLIGLLVPILFGILFLR
jgi:hypothetical protein